MDRLVVSNLSTSFPTDEGLVRSVADVSFAIRAGQTTALVEHSAGAAETMCAHAASVARAVSTLRRTEGAG